MSLSSFSHVNTSAHLMNEVYFKKNTLRTSVEVRRSKSHIHPPSQEIHDTVTAPFNLRETQRDKKTDEYAKTNTHRGKKKRTVIGKRCLIIRSRHTNPGIEMGEGGKFEEFILWKSKQNLMPLTHSVFLTPFLSVCVSVSVCAWFWSIAPKGGRERERWGVRKRWRLELI